MLRATFVPLALLLLLAGLAVLPLQGALGDEVDPAAFLADARAKHVDLTTRGLAALNLRVNLRRSESDSLRNYKDLAGFGYAWKAPAEETFDFQGTHESLQKPLRDSIRGLYREVTGGLFFDFLATLAQPVLAEEKGGIVLQGTTEATGPVRAVFARQTLALATVEFPRARTTFTYGYLPTSDGLQVAWREIVAGDAAPVRTTYRVYRKVNGFPLPTVLDLRSEKNVTEFGLEYRLLNDQPARREDPTADEIRQRVEAFEKAWRGWGDERRMLEIRALAELPDDRVSAAIARLGLKHGEPFVRREAAEALGVMGRASAVPPLLQALKKNDDQIEVYLSIVRALGEIGDPRAVDALSKDWWNQKVEEAGILAARAKISALGRIRHVEAVDALIDTFFMAREETIQRLRPDLLLALGKLTGEDLGDNPRLWRDWWKKARPRFRFD